MRAILMSGLVAFAMASPGSAALMTSTFEGDVEFNALCAGGSAGVGSGDRACELAVGELRGGNNAASGDWEVGFQNVATGSGTLAQADQVWTSGAAGNAFSLSYLAASDLLTLSVAGGASVQNTLDLGSMNSVLIRTRSNLVPGETVSLTGLKLNGADLPDVVNGAAGSAGAKYLQVGGIDWAADWMLTGTATFAWGAAFPTGSKLDVNFKLTDLPAIPLPAASLLLLGGLGALGMVARRRAA